MTAGARQALLPLQQVRAVLEPPRLTRVPGEAAGLAGAAAIRGGVIPVFDLAVLLGDAALARPRRLVVLDHRGGLGLLVDTAEAAHASAGGDDLDLSALLGTGPG